MALVGLNAAADQLQIAREFAVLGDYDTALDWFEQQLGGRVTVVEQRRRATFADLLFGAFGPQAAASPVDQLLTSSTGPRFLYYWQGGR